jgi:hypothetical protein
MGEAARQSAAARIILRYCLGRDEAQNSDGVLRCRPNSARWRGWTKRVVSVARNSLAKEVVDCAGDHRIGHHIKPAIYCDFIPVVSYYICHEMAIADRAARQVCSRLFECFKPGSQRRIRRNVGRRHRFGDPNCKEHRNARAKGHFTDFHQMGLSQFSDGGPMHRLRIFLVNVNMVKPPCPKYYAAALHQPRAEH